MSTEDRRTFQCYPSYKKIGKAVGMSENTVRKYVSMLADKELILTEPTSVITKDGRKQNGSLLYTILPIQIAVDNFNSKQLQQLKIESQRQRLAEYLS
jgi:hypothetical protein